MADNLITCPQCHASFPLNEALSYQILEQARRETEQETAKQRALLEQQRKALEAERAKIEMEATRRADEKRAIEMRDLQMINQEQKRKIEEAQRAELDLRREKREIEEQKKELSLQVQRKIDGERKRIEEQMLARAAQEHHQEKLEAAKREADFKKTIDDLKRRMEQGSQQTQGEVVELELESQLKTQFPNDAIEPVAKGTRGADVLQRVFRNGKPCGTIIWELKQTKAWSDGWIDKLKVDRDAAKADVAVLVSAVLPKGVTTFTQQNGVWITNQACLASLAATLRWSMLQLAITRGLAEGKQGNMQTLFAYLSGSEFRQRVEAIYDGTKGLLEQLESERRLFEKNWSARQKLITRVGNGLLNMRGDLQGLGTSLEHIESIDGAIPELTRNNARLAPSNSPAHAFIDSPDEDDQLFSD